MEVRYRPMDVFPREDTRQWKRVTAHFKTDHSKTLVQLEKELEKLKAEDVLILLDTPKENIRMDGYLRDVRNTKSPRVVVSFSSKYGKIVMACDMFLRWQDNLRAVCLTLERLRMADMYGVTSRGEQYRGWEALPPPGAHVQAKDLGWALDLVARLSQVPQELIKGQPIMREAAIKQARVNAHPDKGGKPDDAQEVGQAAEIIKKELSA